MHNQTLLRNIEPVKMYIEIDFTKEPFATIRLCMSDRGIPMRLSKFLKSFAFRHENSCFEVIYHSNTVRPTQVLELANTVYSNLTQLGMYSLEHEREYIQSSDYGVPVVSGKFRLIVQDKFLESIPRKFVWVANLGVPIK